MQTLNFYLPAFLIILIFVGFLIYKIRLKTNEKNLANAALFFDLFKLKTLLRKGVNPNISTSDGMPILSGVILTDEISPHSEKSKDILFIINALLEAGADPNIRNSKSGNTPLIWATGTHCKTHLKKEIIELLLKAGAIPNLENYYGNTPLMNAEETKDVEIINLLKTCIEKENQIK